MRVLIIDNYDSFIYNLYHLVKKCNVNHIGIMKNDAICWKTAGKFHKIILSPGPGLPSTSGHLLEAIAHWADQKSILGVCLGHQAIAEFFGATLERLTSPLHGVSSTIKIAKHALFKGIQPPIEVGHYHSWVVSDQNMPEELEIIATDQENRCMAIAHKNKSIIGVQFHPESILTPKGYEMMKNWLEMY